MLLPTKKLTPSRSIIGIGADVLSLLDEPKTVSRLWSEFKIKRSDESPVTFDWFVLALDLLYALAAVNTDRGLIHKQSSRSAPLSRKSTREARIE